VLLQAEVGQTSIGALLLAREVIDNLISLCKVLQLLRR